MLSLPLLYPCCHVSGKTLDNTHQVYRFADKIMATESEIVPDRSLESRGPGLRYFRDREVFLSDDSSWDEEEDDNSEADEIKDGDGDAVDVVGLLCRISRHFHQHQSSDIARIRASNSFDFRSVA